MDLTTAIGFAANVASLVVALVAIAFAVWSYSMSKDTETRVSTSLGKIEATTVTLQQLTDKQMHRLTEAVTGPRPFEEALIKSFLGQPNRELHTVAANAHSPSEISNMLRTTPEISSQPKEVPYDHAGADDVSEKVGTPIAPEGLSSLDDFRSTLQAHILKARLSRQERDYSAARHHAESIRSLAGQIDSIAGLSSSDRESLGPKLGNGAVTLEMAAMNEEAEFVFRKAISCDSSFGGCHYQFADFLMDQKRLPEAEEELATAKRLDPDDDRLDSTSVKLAILRGKTDSDLEKRLREKFWASPTDDRLSRNYLTYLTNSGEPHERFENAARHWEESLPDRDKSKAKRVLADYFANVDEHERAADLYAEVLPDAENDEDKHDVLHNLATVLASMGRSREARSTWEQSYRLDRTDDVVKKMFSQFLENEGDLRMAVKVLEGLPI